MRHESGPRHGRLKLFLALAAGLAVGPAMASGSINPDADEILRSMSTFLSGTKNLSVSANISNEIIALDGEKLQFNAHSTLVLERPSRLFATRRGRFADIELYFDGKQATLFGKGLNVYLQREVAGTTDDLFAALESGIGINLPGDDLLAADPYAVLTEGVNGSGYHGTAFVQGVECYHLSFREDQVDWQLWVKTGDEPLPMKYVITTKWTTGAPQYSVELTDWNLKPDVAADRFTFVAPKDAEKLEALPVDDTGEIRIEREAK